MSWAFNRLILANIYNVEGGAMRPAIVISDNSPSREFATMRYLYLCAFSYYHFVSFLFIA